MALDIRSAEQMRNTITKAQQRQIKKIYEEIAKEVAKMAKVYEGKTKAYRTACLDSVAAKYLTEYISSRRIPFNSNEALFISVRGYSKPLDEGGIRGALYAICNRAGLSRRVYPHLFRKTTATNIVKRGGSVQDAGEYLGHKYRTVTGRHYVNIGDDHVMSIFNKFVAMV